MPPKSADAKKPTGGVRGVSLLDTPAPLHQAQAMQAMQAQAQAQAQRPFSPIAPARAPPARPG